MTGMQVILIANSIDVVVQGCYVDLSPGIMFCLIWSGAESGERSLGIRQNLARDNEMTQLMDQQVQIELAKGIAVLFRHARPSKVREQDGRRTQLLRKRKIRLVSEMTGRDLLRLFVYQEVLPRKSE